MWCPQSTIPSADLYLDRRSLPKLHVSCVGVVTQIAMLVNVKRRENRMCKWHAVTMSSASIEIVGVRALKVNVLQTTNPSFPRRRESIVRWHCRRGVDSRLRGNDGVFVGGALTCRARTRKYRALTRTSIVNPSANCVFHALGWRLKLPCSLT